MSIYIFPKNESDNSYLTKFIEESNKLQPTYGFVIRDLLKWRKWKSYRSSTVFVNWLESGLVNNNGNMTVICILKVLLRVIIFRLFFSKAIYVKHNNYPHNYNSKNKKSILRIISLLSHFFHKIVVHSPTSVKRNEVYIPHPLYNKLEVKSAKQDISISNYIVFGRIARYKKIENLVNNFPTEKILSIYGSVKDVDYLKELQLISSDKVNISLFPGYITDDVIKTKLDDSNSLIINHAEEDMIVSGSFFYAISNNISVLAIETPFLKWAESELGEEMIKTFTNIDEMALYIKNRSSIYSFGQNDIEKVNKLFGSDSIFEGIKRAII